MKIEIISIGDELLIGQTMNTNAGWMGEQLLNAGLQVRWITTVGDNRDDMLDALACAESRADVVLLTGGLGPTHDDITKTCVCQYFGAKLVQSERVLEQVKEIFRKRGILMVPSNLGQALVPDNAEIIENNNGTAPGMVFRRNGKSFYVMPGVPREMQGMMTGFILADIQRQAAGAVFVRKTLATSGIPESTLFEQIGNIAEIEKYARIAFLPSYAGVKIRMTARGSTREEANEILAVAEKMVRKNIEKFIFADHDASMEAVIAELLTKQHKTLAIAESCTGGLIANKFTNIPGSSAFLLAGIVSYSNDAKMKYLGVPGNEIAENGAVSAPVAEAMAKGVRLTSGADVAISTTGIAGPSGGSVEKPVGLVYIGYADARESFSKRFVFTNDRLGNKERFAQMALNILYGQISKLKD